MTDQTQPIERRLSSDEAVAFLAELGYPTKKATLNKYVSVGGGPEYEKFGRARKYTGSWLLAWVVRKRRPSQHHSSEQQAA
jgi:hypothetical protein